MGLQVNIKEKNPGIFEIAIIGSIDSSTCPDLEKKVELVLSKAPQVIIFDLGAVTYITSMGLSLMVKTEKAIKEKGKSLIVVNIPHQIKKVFDVISALPSMNIFTSIEEADSYLLKLQRDELDKKRPL
ncbi:MAG: STAS domain-containing protein [Candidatus Omnitrophica bacterium]|nr:STAS domain-containing protein [Candidatus Omnitrophota bacterium]